MGELRVLLDLLVLPVGEAAGLVQYAVGDAELADVVQEGGPHEVPGAFRSQAGAFGHRHGHPRDPLGVTVGEGGLGVDDLGEGAGHEVHALWGGLQGAVVGLQARDLPPRVLLGEVLLQPVFPGLGQQDLHQRGVEPAPAAHPDDLLRRGRAAVGQEDLGRLGEAADPREKRYLLAR